jgi:hypothetical protein
MVQTQYRKVQGDFGRYFFTADPYIAHKGDASLQTGFSGALLQPERFTGTAFGIRVITIG